MSACGRSLHYRCGCDQVEAFYVRCRSWQCEECAPYKLRKLRARICAGKPDMLLTLTCNPERWGSPAEAALAMSAALQEFFRRWRKHLNGKRVPRFVVVEKTKKGWPHFHIAMRSTFVPHALIKGWWHDLTGASIVDVQRVRSQRAVGKYLSKYLSKAPHAYVSTVRGDDGPKTRLCKRHWCSQDWEVEPHEDKAPNFKVAGHRILKECGLDKLAWVLITSGWQIVSRSAEGLHAVAPKGGAPPPLWSCAEDLEGWRSKGRTRGALAA